MVVNMYEDIKKRLASFGYTYLDPDEFTLTFIMKKVQKEVMAECGKLHEDLTNHIVDWVCGEFLQEKKNAGLLADFDLTTLQIKSITEGDTSITYDEKGSLSNEQRLGILIDSLMSTKNKIIKYRVLTW